MLCVTTLFPSAAHATKLLSVDYISSIVTDFADVGLQPLHWTSKEALQLGAIAGITAFLFTKDDSVFEYVQRNRSGIADSIFNSTVLLGDGYVLSGSLLIGNVIANISQDEKLNETTLIALKSYLISGAYVRIGKQLSQRYRPTYGSSETWNGPGLSVSDATKAFPSGHSASAWSVATIIASKYGDNPLVPITSYSLATLASLALVYKNYHWASDVFAGGALGFAVSHALLWKEEKKSLADALIHPQLFLDGVALVIDVPLK